MAASPTEVSVAVPFGELSARVWGPESGRPVLALHGWLDNAATFDTLVPLLDSSLHVVALDFPGHGKSSHLPRGAHYNVIEYVIAVCRVVDQLKWDRFTIIGHSMGGCVGYMYSGLFPKRVLCLITLDIVVPVLLVDSYIPSILASGIKKLQKFEKMDGNAPVYTEEELLERMEDANPGLLSESSKKILLHRGSQPVEGGLVLKRDVRAKTSRTSVLPLVTQKEIVSRYNGDMLIFKCRHKFSSPDLQCVENEFVDIYRTRCKRFHYVELQGGHYVHLNNPELLAPAINAFILASPCQKASL